MKTHESPSLKPGAVQIAGVMDQEEADLVMACGADLLGFPLRLAVHKEDLPEAEAGKIIRRLPPSCPGVIITYLEKAEDIIAFCRALGARYIQLHGGLSTEDAARLREQDPGLFVIKSLVVRSGNEAQLEADVRRLEPHVNAFITDTFDPSTGASGATGKTHDWRVSTDLVRASARPVILAGGLTPDNVYEAVLRVRPAGVDAHTGVEGPDGRKVEARVRRFVSEARRAFAALSWGGSCDGVVI